MRGYWKNLSAGLALVFAVASCHPVFAQGAIQQSVPVFFIEIASSLKKLGKDYTNNDCAGTFYFLKKMGYRPYALSGSKLLEVKDTDALEPIRMYLFLHENKHTRLKEYLTQ